MHIKNRNSNNYQILREILSKSRVSHLPLGARYLLIYAFLYKYCSDSLKDHFMLVLQDEELTLDEAYKINRLKEEFKEDGFHMFGYFIEKSDAFFDEVMNTRFHDKDFLKQFFEAFSENVTFGENSKDIHYFNVIFDTIREEFQFDLYESDPEAIKAIKDMIYSISKLDVFDSNFSFSDVFEVIGDSEILKVDSNPEYIYQILSSILISQKDNVDSIYDPFIGSGRSILSLDNLMGPWRGKKYGKEADKLTYCFTIVRLFINHYSFDSLTIQNENAFESVDINGASFDAILSVIPIIIHNYHTSNKNQSLEIAKRNKRKELEKVLYKEFNMDLSSFSDDNELNNVLDQLINKMDVDEEYSSEFRGEYESLNDSEFLFLINLINCLKDNGMMVISIPQNFLFKDSLKILRKYLTHEKNYIDAIINIPNEFGRYKRPEVIIVFKKNRTDDKILFIDMSRDFETKRARIMVPGIFKRNLLLSDSTISRMVDVLAKRSMVGKYSNLIAIDEITGNGFNLSVSKYVDTFEGRFIRLEDLVDEKREIDERLDGLNEKINMMMDELNIRF